MPTNWGSAAKDHVNGLEPSLMQAGYNAPAIEQGLGGTAVKLVGVLRGLFLASFGLAIGSCSDVLGFQTLPTYRYRIMVEVNTPEGIRRGSSVIAVETHRAPGWVTAPYSRSWSVNGDAVTVDLGRRGKLFMTLRDGTADYSWAQETMLTVIGGGVSGVPADKAELAAIEKIKALKGWHCLKGCPGKEKFSRNFGCFCALFITFDNPADPSSVRLLHSDQFDGKFGADVYLKDIKVSVTDEPVTRTIVSSLPWLANPDAMRRLPSKPPGAWGAIPVPFFDYWNFSRGTTEEKGPSASVETKSIVES